MDPGALRDNKCFANAGGQATALMSRHGGLGYQSGARRAGVGAGGGRGTPGSALTASLLWELSWAHRTPCAP